MDDVNPYASPEVDAKALPAESEVSGAWREGDTLLLKRRGAVLPRACLKTNRSAGVAKYDYVTFSNGWACLIVPLFFVPFVGAGLAMATVSLLAAFGPAAKTRLWFRRNVVVVLVLWDTVAAAFLIAGNIATGIGLFAADSLLLCGIGLAASTIGIGLAVSSERVLVHLQFKITAPDLVRVRGAHPEYLKRLPEFRTRPVGELLDASGSRNA